jgi:Abortive infection C-terminus
MADLLTSPFVMHGAREASEGGLVHIEKQVKGIERAVGENPGLAFDLAKTLVESVCRAALDERSVASSPDDDLPRLFKTATNTLPFLPTEASGEGEIRKSLVQTLNGQHTAIQGICELRNQCGFASHGSGISRPAMESVQALLAAEAADAIVGFLHRVHRQDRTLPVSPRRGYADNPEFNESVDELHERVRIFDEDFDPSRVLFEMAPEPYHVYLADFSQQLQIDETAHGTAAKIDAL